MKKGTKRFISAAVGAAAGTTFVKAVHGTAKNMADMAMNRELTEPQKRLMQATGKPRPRRVASHPADGINNAESRTGAVLSAGGARLAPTGAGSGEARPASMICLRKSRKIPGSSKEQELEKSKNAAAERLRNSACQTVEITAHDGIRLIGHLHLAENPKRTVIAVHGWRASWTGRFGLIADFLYENGCSVLYIEQRAHGASGGKYIGFGLLERYDVLDWIDWVNEQDFACLPIYLFGLSMGAATVLMTAGENLPDNVHGVIADSGYTSPHDEWKYVAENNMHYNYKLMEKYVDKLSMERIGFHADAYSGIQAMQDCRTPVLFIHGTADSLVPIEMTYQNYEACAAPKRLLIVPGAGHCQGYQLEQKRYEEELLRFWRDFDEVVVGS